jgi:hypothetical protein
MKLIISRNINGMKWVGKNDVRVLVASSLKLKDETVVLMVLVCVCVA